MRAAGYKRRGTGGLGKHSLKWLISVRQTSETVYENSGKYHPRKWVDQFVRRACRLASRVKTLKAVVKLLVWSLISFDSCLTRPPNRRRSDMKVLLVYPEFPDTYWSFRHALSFEGKLSAFPPLGLLTVSALLPASWERRLVDMNVRPLKAADIEWADVVLASAMLVQQDSLRRV